MKLGNIAIDRIDTGKRYREDYGNLDELAQSIHEKGLICPIAVVQQETSPTTYLLAAGGRRLAAHKLLEINTIPCRIYNKGLSELELRSIELEENIKRKELGPMEEIKLKSMILKLQQEIHGEKASTAPDAPGVSMRDVAELLGIDRSTLSKEISLDKFTEDFPEIPWEKMETKSEAFKMKNKIEESFIRAEMAKRAEMRIGKAGSSVFLKKLINSYIVQDFFKGVIDIPDNSINFVEIDPPYGIDLQTAKKEYSYDQIQYNEVSKELYPTFLENLFKETYRVMATDSWMICWFAPEPWFEAVYQAILSAGFTCSRMCGIWAKPTGQSKSPYTSLTNLYEMFFCAKKGKPVMAKPGQSNIFQYSSIPPNAKTHPTARPIPLIEDILTTFAHENSRVLVPFAGSGNTLLAAAKNKMVPVGFELSKEYKDSYVLNAQEIFPEK
ncbi:MAG: hypothetical protein DRH37_01190 [Deltaproteobacteria bacterium]|nr:MAG: hypothetical protein DRH37_01190 [Deltaproteobacteria bacterium]